MADQEKQMILAAQRGQADGYKYLMDRYGRQVQLLVAQMVGDVRDVEELTQDAFVRAFRHLSDFDPERASFPTWLSRIAYNTALNRLRLSKAKNHLRSRGLASMPLDEERYRPPDGALWAQDEEETAARNERLMLLDKSHRKPAPRGADTSASALLRGAFARRNSRSDGCKSRSARQQAAKNQAETKETVIIDH